MDQRTLPPPRLAPLPPETTPELKPQFDSTEKRMGFVPNSMLIMQRDPKVTQGYAALSSAVWRADSRVDLKLKRLISHVASRSAGCKYCIAHTAEGSAKLGVDQRSWMRSGVIRQVRCIRRPNVPRSMSRSRRAAFRTR